MEEIHREILVYLSRIIVGVPQAIITDLFFPRKPLSIEERLNSRIRKQQFLILSQNGRVSSQAGVVQEQGRKIRDLENLLEDKESEIKRQVEFNKSLEFQLQEATSRLKRTRH